MKPSISPIEQKVGSLSSADAFDAPTTSSSGVGQEKGIADNTEEFKGKGKLN